MRNPVSRKNLSLVLAVLLGIGLTACHADAPSSTDGASTTHSTTHSAVPDPTTTAGTTAAPPAGRKVVIDPGHQAKANYEKEPLGPGSSEMKTKVAAGATGCVTGTPEYELTLAVSLKLQAELVSRGYEVILIRTTNDVNISNAERAQIANLSQAGAFLRIHADGYDDPSVHGASTLCQTRSNPYNGSLYPQCRALADAVLDGLTAAAGCRKRSVQETDSMSGINWCQIPVTIVEIGFLSNPDEDRLLSTEEYQNKIVVGIANGLDTYFDSLS